MAEPPFQSFHIITPHLPRVQTMSHEMIIYRTFYLPTFPCGHLANRATLRTANCQCFCSVRPFVARIKNSPKNPPYGCTWARMLKLFAKQSNVVSRIPSPAAQPLYAHCNRVPKRRGQRVWHRERPLTGSEWKTFRTLAGGPNKGHHWDRKLAHNVSMHVLWQGSAFAERGIPWVVVGTVPNRKTIQLSFSILSCTVGGKSTCEGSQIMLRWRKNGLLKEVRLPFPP